MAYTTSLDGILADRSHLLDGGQLSSAMLRVSMLGAAIMRASIPSVSLRTTAWAIDLTAMTGVNGSPMTGDGCSTLTGPDSGSLWFDAWRVHSGTQASSDSSVFRATTSLPSAQIVDAAAKPIQPPHLEAIQWIKEVTGLSQERTAELIGVSRQTLNRWNRGEPIKSSNRQRIFAARGILECAVTKHATREQLLAWLDTPQLADAATPAQLLAAGKFDRARLLAITTPSPRVKRPPSWVGRPIPEAFRARAEHMQVAMPPDDDSLDIDFQE